MLLRIIVLLVAVICLTSCVFGQTFQYSRGWTNGKRASIASREAACQLHKLKNILEGRGSIAQLYYPCEVPPYFDPMAGHHSEVGGPLPSELDDQ